MCYVSEEKSIYEFFLTELKASKPFLYLSLKQQQKYYIKQKLLPAPEETLKNQKLKVFFVSFLGPKSQCLKVG